MGIWEEEEGNVLFTYCWSDILRKEDGRPALGGECARAEGGKVERGRWADSWDVVCRGGWLELQESFFELGLAPRGVPPLTPVRFNVFPKALLMRLVNRDASEDMPIMPSAG